MPRVKIIGTIELEYPRGMTSYEAWQRLESHLEDPVHLDENVSIHIVDYYFGRREGITEPETSSRYVRT